MAKKRPGPTPEKHDRAGSQCGGWILRPHPPCRTPQVWSKVVSPQLMDLLSPPTPPNSQLRMHFPDILPLDVRGRYTNNILILPMNFHVWYSNSRKINVNRSFLTRYPNSYLAEMFSANSRYTPARFERSKSQDTSNESEMFRLADGSYSIDADPECFMVIINFLQVWFYIISRFGPHPWLQLLQYDRVILPSFGGPTIEDIGFVANQLALGSEISLQVQYQLFDQHRLTFYLQLKRAEERVAEERLRLLSPARLPDWEEICFPFSIKSSRAMISLTNLIKGDNHWWFYVE